MPRIGVGVGLRISRRQGAAPPAGGVGATVLQLNGQSLQLAGQDLTLGT